MPEETNKNFVTSPDDRDRRIYHTGDYMALGEEGNFIFRSIRDRMIKIRGQPIIGYNYGSGNKKRLSEIIRYEYNFEIFLSIMFTGILFPGATVIMRLLGTYGNVLVNNSEMLRYISLGLVPMAICLVTTCIFQSVGQATRA